jgi:hypothetical protein
MSILDYIDPLYFLIALTVGLIFTYLTAPQPQMVIKYPTPFNAGKVTYVDQNDVCYKYQMKKVTCPVDQSKVKSYQFQ